MRIEKSFKNVVSGVIGQILTLILSFIVRTFFIHELDIAYLGVSGLFGNILSILSFAELGFGQAIVYALYKPIANSNYDLIKSYMLLFKRVYIRMFFIVLSLGLLFIPFLPFVVKDFDVIPNLYLIYVLYVFTSASSYLFSYYNTFLIATQNNYISTIIGYFFSFILSIGQILILVFTHNFILYLVYQILIGLLQNVFISYKTRTLFPFLSEEHIKPLSPIRKDEIKRNVKALAVYKIGTLSLNSTDNIIMSKFVGLLSVGLYSNYYLLQYTVNGLLSAVFSNLTASIGNFNASESSENKFRMFCILNLLAYWCYTVAAICLFICMTPFIRFWIGEKFVMSNDLSFIIAFNTYIAGMLYSAFNYRQTMGLFVQGKIRPIISAVENIILSIIFVQFWGVSGVLWGTAVTRLTTNVWYDPYIVFKKGLKVEPLIYFSDYLYKLAVAFAVGAILYYITSLIPDVNIFSLFIKAFISFFGANLLLYIFFHHTDEFKYLVQVFTGFCKRKYFNY